MKLALNRCEALLLLLSIMSNALDSAHACQGVSMCTEHMQTQFHVYMR